MNHYILRAHEPFDLPAMEQINRENHMNKGGVLVGPLYPDKNYFVYEMRGKVVAYVNVLEDLPARVWETQLVPGSEIGDGVYIKQIAVAKAFQRQMIGMHIYNYLRNCYYHNRCIYAHVHCENIQSLNFHLQNSFRVIGMWKSKDFNGVHDYLSYLMEYRP